MTFSPTLNRLIVGLCAIALLSAAPMAVAATDPGDEALVRATLQAEGQRWQSVPDQAAAAAYERATLQAGGQRLVNAPDSATLDAHARATMEAEGQRMVTVANPQADGDLVVTMQPDGQIFSAPIADILWLSPLTTAR